MLGSAQAEQPDDVDDIGVKFEFGPGLVTADVAPAAVVGIATVENMTEQVAFGILDTIFPIWAPMPR